MFVQATEGDRDSTEHAARVSRRRVGAATPRPAEQRHCARGSRPPLGPLVWRQPTDAGPTLPPPRLITALQANNFFISVFFSPQIVHCNQPLTSAQTNSFSNRKTSIVDIKVSKVSSYIAQNAVLRTVQSALHFISLANVFNQTPSQLLWEASSHMVQLIREG